jgi:hypothetical protein
MYHHSGCPRGDLNTQNREISLGPGKQLHASYTQDVDDDLLVIETSWPGTTIDGDPRIVSGLLSVSRAAGGEFLLNLSVGPPDGAPEDFIPEGAGRCQGVSACRFCGGMAFAGHGGMALWLAFPDRCRVRVSGLAGQGPGGARPRSGAAGVLDALVREPIMAGAGKGRGRVHGLCGYGRPIAGCPAGRPAGCLHPFGCAPAWRAGGHGAGSRPGTGGADHISVPAGPAGAGCGGEHKTSRPRARPGRQLTLPG